MDPISSTSTIYVKSFVEGAEGREDVHAALVAPGTKPGTGDWREAEWGAPTAAGCVAQLLVGPDGVVAPGVGMWDLWVKVTSTVQRPELLAGQVPIF